MDNPNTADKCVNNTAIPEPGNDELMTEKEFLSKIKICRAQLNRYKAKGLITHFKVGRKVLYDSQSFRDFKNNCVHRIEARRQKCTPPRRA
jgi:hypothetical protein